MERKVSVHVDIHYTETKIWNGKNSKSGVSLYRNDCFIFPHYNEDENKEACDYIYCKLSQPAYDKLSTPYICVTRLLETDRRDSRGLTIFEKTPCKMFQSNGNGVVTITEWDSIEGRYTLCEHHVTVKGAMIELKNEIEIQTLWYEL